MPESSCLHIQDSASGPIRVVEIPWSQVRVGRASFCEVRLNDPDLAGEICRLQRRGGIWQIEPIVADSVQIDGRPVNGIRLLPFDTPIQIGSYCLTLLSSKLAAPNWSSYQARDVMKSSVPASPSIVSAVPSAGIDRGPEIEKPGSALREQQRWEDRWRAAGEKLRAASPPNTPRSSVNPSPIPGPGRVAPVDAARPVPHVVPQAFRPEPIPLWEAIPPRPPVTRSTPTARRPVDWTPPIRPAELSEPIESGSWRAGSVNRRSESPHEDMGPMPPARHLAEDKGSSPSPRPDPEPVATLDDAVEEFVEPSVDARISAWNPTWFDQQPAQDPDEPTSILSPEDEDASRFAAGTEWVAPAECLGTITTSFEDKMDLEPPPGFTASSHGAQSQAIQSKAAPQDRVPIELDSTSASRRTNRAALLIADPGPDRRRGGSGTTRTADLPNQALPRSVDAPSRDTSGDWPSVDDILAAHRPSPADWENSRRPMTGTKQEVGNPRRGPSLAAPSVARAPDCWEVPLWLGWPPLAFVSLLLGVLGCAMSWSWTLEARSASIVANRLLGKEAEVVNGRPIPLPDWVVPSSPTWWRSTPRHLMNWAVYLGRSAEARERGDEIRALLDGALGASPIYAPARLALARIEEVAGGPSTRGMALSRDPISLAWAARSLLKAGRKDVAFPLYRRALELATRPEYAPETFPKFSDDPQARRYLLPGEEVVRIIVADLVSDRSLKFTDWLSVLPEGTVAPLVAARLLRNQNRKAADASLDVILEWKDPAVSDGPASAIRFAARAEAFVSRSKWKDAEQQYLAAIDRIDHEATRRSWWFNLADIELQLKNEAQRQEAIEEALASAPTTDEIARRAADLRRGPQIPTEQVSRMRGAGLKAN